MQKASFWKMLSVAIFLSGCSSRFQLPKEKPVKELYGSARRLMEEKRYVKAADMYDEVDRHYPYSDCATKAQLLAAFCAFKAGKYSRAISTLDVFIELHPASPSIDYAYYLRAMAYYMNMMGLQRDQENSKSALEAFKEILKRFPTTEYAHDARIKIDFVCEHLASHDMMVAKQYLEDKRYVAAWISLSSFLQDWPRSILTPEVMYRLVECQVGLGMVSVSDKTMAVLKYNFPESVWTARACQLIEKAKEVSEKK